MKTCPRCYAPAFPVRTRGFVKQRLLAAVGLRLYFCEKCFHRFHRRPELEDHRPAGFDELFRILEKRVAVQEAPFTDIIEQIREAELRQLGSPYSYEIPERRPGNIRVLQM